MNCVMLTTLMKGFIRGERREGAMSIFESMKNNPSFPDPDLITYSLLIKAHCEALDMTRALECLEDMLQAGCEVDDVVFTHLIEGCTGCGTVQLAEKLFNDMISSSLKPSVYTVTAMVKVYGKCGMCEKAQALVKSMQLKCGIKPTVVVYTCLISGLIRGKKVKEA